MKVIKENEKVRKVKLTDKLFAPFPYLKRKHYKLAQHVLPME